MKIVLATNLDAYRTNCWPTNLVHVPRVGERVSVVDVFIKHFSTQRLPTFLEVKTVTHTYKAVIVDLWYSETDVKLYDIKPGHGL